MTNLYTHRPLHYIDIKVGLWGEGLRDIIKDHDAVDVLCYIEQAQSRITKKSGWRVYETRMADIAWWDSPPSAKP
jgi:hypothetical protein